MLFSKDFAKWMYCSLSSILNISVILQVSLYKETEVTLGQLFSQIHSWEVYLREHQVQQLDFFTDMENEN